MKKLITWEYSRVVLMKGIERVYDMVKVTMWLWRNVVIQTNRAPIVTNDWVTVARSIELEWEENIGAQLVIEAAEKTNNEAGDWTTTTVVGTYGICKEWMKYIKEWMNAFELVKWLHSAVDGIIKKLKESAKQITTPEQIQQVASISAQDEEIWTMISDIIQEVWNDWVVTVDEWHIMWLSKEIKIWMQFNQWYISPYFVTDLQKMESVILDPYIIITDKNLLSYMELLPTLERIIQVWKSKNVVIIADNVDGEALAWVMNNKNQWLLNIVAIKAPSFWDNKKEMLLDICTVTGAKLISDSTFINVKDCPLEALGRAKKVITNWNNTTIIEWIGTQEDIDERVAVIKWQIKTQPHEIQRQKESLARLTSGIAVIYVLCATEMETNNKRQKIEDALNTTRCAIEEWIVIGGGLAVLSVLREIKEDSVALDILREACTYPFFQIISNAGYTAAQVLKWDKWFEDSNWFNAKTWEYGNMFDMWVIDSCKVVRIALKNAVSVAAMLLTTECIIADQEIK